MASTTTIPVALSLLPCVLTDAQKAPLAERDFSIVKVCQREASPTIVDIWYEVSRAGTWVMDLNESGYKSSNNLWYMLKPDFSDPAHDGTQVQVSNGGDWVSFTLVVDKRTQFRFVWDVGAEYDGFLSDPEIPLFMTFKVHADTVWYAWKDQAIVGTNDAGNQTLIVDPTA